MVKNDKIQLASHNTCTGCSACVSVCPTGSISMKEDREGFLQPQIDAKTCIGCHKCEKTCPILNPIEIPTDFETQAYAAINKDEAVRMRSSSGGMFHALAKWTIEQGGVVFGARFDENWDVIHDYTETIEGIEPFMRSKYVQSRIGDTFKQAKHFLDQGRQVLFVGTPCQIGGLKAYLKKDYDNLLAVDFICHGVPSPGVWRKYLKEAIKGDTLLDFNFRDKKDGWLDFQCVTTTTTTTTTREKKRANLYMYGFLENVFLRKSCYHCKYKTIKRLSDVTLADCWGVQFFNPQMNDNKGTSLLLLQTAQGIQFLSNIPNCSIISIDIAQALYYNKRATSSVLLKKHRWIFFIIFNILGTSKSIKTISRLVKIYNKLKKIKIISCR